MYSRIREYPIIVVQRIKPVRGIYTKDSQAVIILKINLKVQAFSTRYFLEKLYFMRITNVITFQGSS